MTEPYTVTPARHHHPAHRDRPMPTSRPALRASSRPPLTFHAEHDCVAIHAGEQHYIDQQLEQHFREAERTGAPHLAAPRPLDPAFGHYLAAGLAIAALERGAPVGFWQDPQRSTRARDTAWVSGDPTMPLLAHLQCVGPSPSFVEGPDRAWLAGRLERALLAGALRPKCNGHRFAASTGWVAAITLLRAVDDAPVVLTAGGLFPCPSLTLSSAAYEVHVPDDAPDEALMARGQRMWAQFAALPAREQWARAIAALRRDPRRISTRITPATWGAMHDGPPTLEEVTLEEVMDA